MNREIQVIQREVTSKYPDINSGGCGLFAYVYKKHFPQSQLYVMTDSYKNVNHVLVKHEDIILDGEKCFQSFDEAIITYCHSEIVEPLEFAQLERLVYTHTWNRWFWGADWTYENAERWVKRMEELFDNYLKQIQAQ